MNIQNGNGPIPTPNQNPFDQGSPVKAGYRRVAGFMDVANYNDALFQEYVKGDRMWEFILNKTGLPNDPTYREAHFNTEHFENSLMAQHWNFFVELRGVGVPEEQARKAMQEAFGFDR